MTTLQKALIATALAAAIGVGTCQARIFAEVVTHFQVEPGTFGFNFNF